MPGAFPVVNCARERPGFSLNAFLSAFWRYPPNGSPARYGLGRRALQRQGLLILRESPAPAPATVESTPFLFRWSLPEAPLWLNNWDRGFSGDPPESWLFPLTALVKLALITAVAGLLLFAPVLRRGLR